MLLITTCWLFLWLPGCALLRRVWPRGLDGGLLSAVALGYLTSFTLLTPVSVVAYLWRLPLATLSIAMAVLAAAGATDLVLAGIRALRSQQPGVILAQRVWQWLGVSPIAIIGGWLVINNAVAGLAFGSPLMGDAHYHMGRVRMIVDLGFNSWDPMLVPHRFDTIYHTNLYHALMAAIAQLTSLPPADVWVYTLFFARLLAACSIYHLAWVLLGKRSLAWIAAGMFAVSAGSSWLLTIPNNVSVYGLITLGLAFLVQLLVERSLWPALGLLATCVVLPQFHGLCFAFLAMAVGPVLGLAFVRAALRRQPGRGVLALGLAGLLIGGLWLIPQLPERAHNAVAPSPPDAAKVHAATTNADRQRARAEAYKGFIDLPGHMVMYDPATLRNALDPGTQLLVALIVGLFTSRRRQLSLLLAGCASLLVVLFVPPICTLAFNVAGHSWMLLRIWGVIQSLQPAIVPGAFLLFASERLFPLLWRWPLPVPGLTVVAPRWRVAAALISALAPIAGLAAAMLIVHFVDGKAAHWPSDNRFRRSRHRATAVALQGLADERAFLKRNVEPGATVVVWPVHAYDLMMTCNCYALALPQGRNGDYGVPDMELRREATSRLLSTEAGLEERIELLRRYKVHHVYVPHYLRADSRLVRRMYGPLIVGSDIWNGDQILKLSLSGPLSRAPAAPAAPSAAPHSAACDGSAAGSTVPGGGAGNPRSTISPDSACSKIGKSSG